MASDEGRKHYPDSPATSSPHRRKWRRGGVMRMSMCIGAAALALIGVLTGLALASGPGNPSYELTADLSRLVVPAGGTAEKGVVAAEEGFALRLTERLVEEAGDHNVVLSPASVALALTMLELGARGTTQTQIAALLGEQGASAATQAAGWDALSSELTQSASQNGTSLQITESTWQQQGLPVRPAYLQALARYFQSGMFQADFARDPVGATNRINSWVSRQTKGLIPQLFNPGALKSAIDLVLVNAIYFHARWAHAFASSTSSVPFYSPGGRNDVPMMSQSPPERPAAASSAGTDLFSQQSGYTAVEIPYQGGALAALVLEPRGSSLPSFIGSLDAASLSRIVAGLRPVQGTLTMPTLSLSSTRNLSHLLASLGMPLAFSSDADFSGISPVAQQLAIVQHAAVLQVDQTGTTAAAATGVGMETVSGVLTRDFQITIDHPFLFLIRDVRSGAILFTSAVESPASA